MKVPEIIARNTALIVTCSQCECRKFTILGRPNHIYQCMECGYPNLEKELEIGCD